jgi:CHAD domain-containing protein
MRVAARRLRSGLRVFRPLLDRDWADRLRAELAWVAHGLTGLREQSVLLDRLDHHAAELPADLPIDKIRALLSRELGRSRDAARAAAIDLLGTDRYLQLHDALVSAANRPAFTPAAERTARDALPGLVEREWKRLDKAASGLRPDSPDDDWHQARLAAKRVRYAAEAVAPSIGDDVAAFAGQIERLTDILGEHQDAVQAADAVRSLAVELSTDPAVAFGLGTLAAAERRRVDDARARFVEAWPEVRRARWRKWFAS